MKRLLLTIGLVLVIVTLGYAIRFEGISVPTSGAARFSPYLINETSGAAAQAVCTLETNNIRFRLDGANPTASSGILWIAGSTTLVVNGQDKLQGFRAIAIGGNATLQCHYY